MGEVPEIKLPGPLKKMTYIPNQEAWGLLTKTGKLTVDVRELTSRQLKNPGKKREI